MSIDAQAIACPGLSYEAYARLAGVRASELKVLCARTPAHLKAYRAAESRDTDALRFGKAVHLLALEPDRALDAVLCGPDCGRRSNADKAAWAEVEAKAAARGGVVLSYEDYKRAEACARAVLEHEEAGGLLTMPGERELSITWTERGLPAKARIDLCGTVLVDLKTTRDASEERFSRDVFALGYHIQADWYTRAALAAGLQAFRFVFVAVESAPPFAVKLHEVGPVGKSLARNRIDAALDALRRAEASGVWDGYPSGVNLCEPPPWLWEKLDEEDA